MGRSTAVAVLSERRRVSVSLVSALSEIARTLGLAMSLFSAETGHVPMAGNPLLRFASREKDSVYWEILLVRM